MNSSRSPTDSQWSRIELLLEKFETQWRGSQRPGIKPFLAEADSSSRTTLLLELIKLDLEYAAAAGEAKLIEDYVAEFPELALESAHLQELELEYRRVQNQFAALPADSHHHEMAGHPPLQRVGRYEVREQIGSGGFASVYRAWDPQLKREVALKLPTIQLRADVEGRARMLREAQGAARLHHPGIVPIHEVGEHAGTVFIVYEYIRGESLAERIKREALALDEIAQCLMALVYSLHYAHQCGVVHRDVKPANILLTQEGAPLIADFGLALLEGAEESLTREGDILGTPAYMSPEQASGNSHAVDARTDVYSAGVILYELLSGCRPFDGSGISLLRQVMQDEPRAPSTAMRSLNATRQTLSSHSAHKSFSFRDLETICLKAIAKAPARRYQSAAELADDLRRFLHHQPILARRTGPLGRLGLWCQRRPALATTLATSILLIAAVIGFSYRRVVQERDRYLAQKEAAEVNLYQALFREAQSLRIARKPGYRNDAWLRIQQAAAIDIPQRDVSLLRHEAVACMGDFLGIPPVEIREFGSQGLAIAGAFDPSNRQLAIGLTTGGIRFFDCPSGTLVDDIQTEHARVFGIAFAPDGKRMIVGDDEGGISLWNRHSEHWRQTRMLRIGPSNERNYVHPISLAVSSDSSRLIASSKSAERVSVIDLETGEILNQIAALDGDSVYRVALSPSGDRLAVLYYSDRLAMWDMDNHIQLAAVDLQLGSAMNVAFGSRGDRIAVTFESGVGVYDAQTLSRMTHLRGSLSLDSEFLRDGLTLAVPQHETGSVDLWDTHHNRRVATLDHQGQPHSVIASGDGDFLASIAASSVRLWNLRGGNEATPLERQSAAITSLAFSPDGGWLMSSASDGRVVVWSTDTWKPLLFADGLEENARALCFSADGKYLATCGPGAIYIWDAARLPEKALLQTIEIGPGEQFWNVAFSPDGRYFSSAGTGGLRLREVLRNDEKSSELTFRSVELDRPTTQTVGSAIFAPDSSRLFYVDQSAMVHGWNIDARQEFQLPSFFAGIGSGLAFSSASGELIGVDHDGLIQIRQLDTESQFALADGDVQDQGWTYREIALSPDDRWLLRRAQGISVWDLGSRKRLFRLSSGSSPVCFAWRGDQMQIATGSANGDILVWHLGVVRQRLGELGISF